MLTHVISNISLSLKLSYQEDLARVCWMTWSLSLPPDFHHKITSIETTIVWYIQLTNCSWSSDMCSHMIILIFLRFTPYSQFEKCRICRTTIHQPHSKYCQGCAYKKGNAIQNIIIQAFIKPSSHFKVVLLFLWSCILQDFNIVLTLGFTNLTFEFLDGIGQMLQITWAKLNFKQKFMLQK